MRCLSFHPSSLPKHIESYHHYIFVILLGYNIMANDSKQKEAAKDAEAIDVPPPTYQEVEVSHAIVSTEDFEIITAQGILRDESRPGVESPASSKVPKEKDSVMPDQQPATDQELKMTDASVAEGIEKTADHVRFDQGETTPPLPTRPSSIDPNPALIPQNDVIPLKYTLSWKRPLLAYPTLSIRPTCTSTIPSTIPNTPPTSHWTLNYDNKYSTRLNRHAARIEPDQTPHPTRQIAEIKFPTFIWPGCGPTVIFEPHEEEIARRGSNNNNNNATRTETSLRCKGTIFTTTHAIDLPILPGSRVVWQAIPPPQVGGPSGSKLDSSTASPAAAPRPVKLVTVGDIVAQARKTIHDETWTPYPQLRLVVEGDGTVLATYSRAAPWARDFGSLEIVPPSAGSATSEYVEGIVVGCVAVVGMQNRMGLASSLLPAMVGR
jgi:hypothetical protein